MHVEVTDIPLSRTLVATVNGNVNSASALFSDYWLSGVLPRDKRPQYGYNVALPYYRGTWGEFCARMTFSSDGRIRLSLMSPQAISTGYTCECRCNY